jgi:hypothetical protein
MEKRKRFRIIYEVHCKLQNFFNKEIIIKNCLSELQAKVWLNDFCKRKYGKEFDFLIVISINPEKEKSFENLDGLDSILNELMEMFKIKKK